MPSVVFRDAGGIARVLLCIYYRSRNALSGLSRCRGGPAILLYRNDFQPLSRDDTLSVPKPASRVSFGLLARP